ncbi:MAG: hypothetical protein AAF414_01755 [Pseudomonadota bacterium]
MSTRQHAPRYLTLALIVALSTATVTPGYAQADPLTLGVSNNSAMPLESVQISPDYSPRWGGNRLEGTVNPGQIRIIPMPDSGLDCFFDVQIGDAAGQVFQYWGVNLCARPNIDHR